MKTITINKPLLMKLLSFLFLALGFADAAVAGSAQGFGWENTLEMLMNSLQYVGYFIAVIAMVIWAVMTAFGGDLGSWGQKAVNMMLVLGLIGGGGIQVIINALGGQSALM